MIIAMQETATEQDIQNVAEHMIQLGFQIHRSTGVRQTVLGVVGANTSSLDSSELELLPGVAAVHRITSPYKLVGRRFRPDGTVVKFANGLEIGGRDVAVMAGPGSVESRQQLFMIAEQVAAAGATILRGGAYKPRSSPYAFQGMGKPGLELLREAADTYRMLVVSEVMEIGQIETMLPYVDIFQVGARNMQNFNLLRELGQIRRPVMLKRGIAATIEELLLAAEYLLSGGNYDVILCERGIRTFETCTRNTMDISAIPVVHSLSHLPIAADPSHGTGRRDKVVPMARAAVAAGADVIMVEVHHDPDHALSDGAQSLYPHQFTSLMHEVNVIASAVGRGIAKPLCATRSHTLAATGGTFAADAAGSA